MINFNLAADDLQRFIEAQSDEYETALQEIRQGNKRSHWVWFVFPQLRGLGRSEYSNYYGIADLAEAKKYLNHNLLGARLREATEALLAVKDKTAVEILGEIDALKVRSSMTLFDAVCPDDIFRQVLVKYYGGVADRITLNRLLYQNIDLGVANVIIKA